MFNTVSYQDLKDRATNVISTYVANGASFTAYDVTKTIRMAYPGDDVQHATVREIVRDVMATHATYIGESKDFGAYEAIEYHLAPVPVVAAPTAQATPLHKRLLPWLFK